MGVGLSTVQPDPTSPEASAGSEPPAAPEQAAAPKAPVAPELVAEPEPPTESETRSGRSRLRPPLGGKLLGGGLRMGVVSAERPVPEWQAAPEQQAAPQTLLQDMVSELAGTRPKTPSPAAAPPAAPAGYSYIMDEIARAHPETPRPAPFAPTALSAWKATPEPAALTGHPPGYYGCGGAKMDAFLTEPLGRQADIESVPGVGRVGGGKITTISFSFCNDEGTKIARKQGGRFINTRTQLVGAFLLLDGDRDAMSDLLREANVREADIARIVDGLEQKYARI